MALLERLKERFTARPLPDAVFEVAADYVSGIRVSRRNRTAAGKFILPLNAGGLAASFDRPNIADASELLSRIEDGKARLGLSGGTASVLIPEPCVRIFIMPVDSVPNSQAERDAFVRWRAGKQMPLVHNDLTLAYAVSKGPESQKVIACLARQSVIREYETLFAENGLDVGTVTVASLSLLNLLDVESGPQNGLLLNVAGDYVSLFAVVASEWTLYRQKAFLTDSRTSWTIDQKIDQLAKEISNTVHFLEDKEQKKVEKVWVRTGVVDDGTDIIADLSEVQALPVEPLDFPVYERWDAREKAILAPLMGHIR